MTNLDSILKSRDITLPTKVHLVKAMVFPVIMYGCELDYKESWAQKNWCFWIVVLEKILESPLDFKEIQPVHPKGDQSWVSIGRTDVEAKTPILWPPDAKSWLIWKDPDAGKDWRWEKKGTTEDEMVRWHHWLNGHEFEWTLGVGDGQGSLACCSSWGHKESDMTELDWTELVHFYTPQTSSQESLEFLCSFPFSGASQVALVVKNPPANAGDIRDAGLIPGSGRSPGEWHGFYWIVPVKSKVSLSSLQYSCLENPMDRGAWKSTVHGVAKSWTRLKWLSRYALPLQNCFSIGLLMSSTRSFGKA